MPCPLPATPRLSCCHFEVTDEAAGILFELPLSEVAEVKRVHDVMAGAWDGDDWNFALNAHKDFHRQICLLAGNKRLTSVHDVMAHQTMLLLVTAAETVRGLLDPPLEEIHLAMADAVVARDTKAAERAVRKHYNYTRTRLLAAMEEAEL